MANPNSALIADDEKHIRSYVRLILNRLGVEEVYEANDGASAVESYKENKPDLVLLDINMPGMTGLEVLPKILEMDPEAVVVMLTGHASRHLIEGSAKAGAVNYIRKDTPQQEISDMLTELFNEIYEED
jgi:two-component system chemotaxis response regulator CheY